VGKKYKILIVVLLLIWYGLFLVHKIDLTTVDLGRHIKNGEVLLAGQTKVLTTNFYSYTQPDFPTVNHHWAGGVIFYLISKFAGLSFLHLLSVVLSLLTFVIFFYTAQKESNSAIPSIFAFLVIPLIAERTEVRPEVFSNLFSGLFFLLLWYYRRNSLPYSFLFALPLLELFWVNIHIYFILGLFLVGVYLLMQRTIKLFLIFLLTSFATLLNPAGLAGSLEPFNIYQNFGYRVLELQSVHFLDKLGFIANPNLLLIKVISALVVLSFVWVIVKFRKDFSFLYLFLATVFGAMAWVAIRNFTIFGLFSLPIISANLKKIRLKSCQIIFLAIIVFCFTIFNSHQHLTLYLNNFGLGLMTGNNGSAEFFKTEGVSGPVLNNYDIGGYLIYHLFPKERVFVDGRPESYSVEFFEKIYVPLQDNEDIWKEQDEIYKFNTIFFAYHDATPWAQKFLFNRLRDQNWALVYADPYALILLRKNEVNKNVIEKYETLYHYSSL
jgi:hypothetical protein